MRERVSTRSALAAASLAAALLAACQNQTEPAGKTEARPAGTAQDRRTTAAPTRLQGAALETFKAKIKSGLVPPALAKSAAAAKADQSCPVTFDDYTAIANTYNQSRLGYVSNSGKNASGSVVQCSEASGRCWYYKQACGSYYVHAEPTENFQMLLYFDDPNLNCVTSGSNPGFGYSRNGTCVAPTDYAAVGRYVTGHSYADWFQFSLKDANDNLRTFNFPDITVGSGSDIQLWYQLTDGSVWGWDDLGKNTDWSLGITGAVAVWVGTANGSGSPLSVTGFNLNY